MTIKKMIEGLMELGYTQGSIADAVGATQPTIHRALNGSDIRYTTGKAIESLYTQKLAESPDQPEALLDRRDGERRRQTAAPLSADRKTAAHSRFKPLGTAHASISGGRHREPHQQTGASRPTAQEQQT